MKIAFIGGGVTAEAAFTLESVRHLNDVACSMGHSTTILACSRAKLRDARWLSELLSCDVAFPLISGLEGYFDALGIPYVGSTATVAGIAANKGIFNDLLVRWGYRKTPYVRLHEDASIESISPLPFSYPIFVKPARLGASLGIVKVRNESELIPAIRAARGFDQELVIEQGVQGAEVEVAVIAGASIIASEPGVVRLPVRYEWHDVESKEYAEMEVPADLPDNLIEDFKSIAVRLVSKLGAEGAVRFDFFLNEHKEILIGEVNCLPGHDKISNFPILFEKSGLDRSEQLRLLIDGAIYGAKKSLEATYKF